ncbi:helix-turn-helix domain-containing protein [Streptomyces violaceus]|uniref:Helix-turn-helix transcriptional regulator n=1 Tax=Streptomyces violaceus TaxID=1936 RepID=A0ABY9UFH8_STRVL|nr:helix-turn-helix transcriptional regulator [Streptomyces janthinus]WND19011.1 helix-turn-helix transcriptional regulator [Streptomyces janthinus]GGS89176.1 transcriptional regulator [Streptomyces janthinus]
MSRRNGGAESGASTAAVFGEVLRHFREAALLSQEGLARQIPCDRSHVARVEAGTRVPTDGFAKTCDELLATSGVLTRLWGRIDWYPQVEHPDWFRRRAEMDEVAVALREYQERVIPGLLQTPEYAQALFSRRRADAHEIESRVHARMSRQQRFLADGGPLYVAILDESCLRNAVGSPEVMRQQCAHLLSVGQSANIRLQVAPADLFGLVRPRGSMSLIELTDERWVYSESLDRGHFSNDPALYARHSHTYDVLRADILSARQSAALISDVMERYEQHGQLPTQRGVLDQEQLQRRQWRQLHRNSPRFPRHRPRPRQQNP